MKAADEEVVAGVLQVLKDRARVLPHQDRVRRVVVNAELIADAVLLADPVQRDPGARRVGDVVVPVVAGRPPGHRALLDAVGQPACLRRLEQRHELRFEIEQVLVHAALLVAADEAADGIDAEQRRGVEHAQHEVVLLLAHRRIVVQHVVEVADVRQADAARLQRALDAARAILVERLRAGRACSRPDPASPRAARRSRWDAARPTAGCSSAFSSLANATHSSIARSGSGSRTARGVNSCSAAVSTPTFMNFGSNDVVGMRNILH